MPILKIKISVLILGRKALIVSIVRLNFLFKIRVIQNSFLRVSRRENSRMFPSGLFYVVFLMKYLSKCLTSTASLPHPFLRNFWLHICTHLLFVLQNAPSLMFDSVLNISVLVTAQ